MRRLRAHTRRAVAERSNVGGALLADIESDASDAVRDTAAGGPNAAADDIMSSLAHPPNARTHARTRARCQKRLGILPINADHL